MSDHPIEQKRVNLVQIDEQGYPAFSGIRVTDQGIGHAILKNLSRKSNGTFETCLEDKVLQIESFDAPLIAKQIETTAQNVRLTFPYGLQEVAAWESLTLDEWDRVRGRLASEVPFVLSRSAQASLFDQVEAFDDDSFTLGGIRHSLKPWLPSLTEIHASPFWSKRYVSGETGWDLGKPAPAFTDMLPRMKWPRSRILVLGCGRGHDAAFFADNDHLVTAVDFSAEAIGDARRLYGDRENLRWLQADALQLPTQMHGQFDVIIEHTLYCAIDPAFRSKLVQAWLNCLAPRGHLMGLFFVHDKFEGPPFGGSEWEVRERLRHLFQFRFWGRWDQSPSTREGIELFVFAQALK